MPSVKEHYERLLAPIYTWMAGGAEAAITDGWLELSGSVPPAGLAVDLGAGFGAHTIALARRGWRVVAVDTAKLLLAELAERASGLPVAVACDDLLNFPEHLPRGERPAAVLCMGDTLTHLSSREDVRGLCQSVAECLLPGGKFIATFRDYTSPPAGAARFIPVRADDDRLLTCFIESAGEFVRVHDLLQQRTGSGWKTTVGDYLKLRLPPEWLCDEFRRLGLAAAHERGARGMVRVVVTA